MPGGGPFGIERRVVGADGTANVGPADRRAPPGATIGCSWKVCCGSCGRGLPGAISQRYLVIGIACSDASADGASRVFGGGYSTRCPMIRTEYPVVDYTIVRAHQHAAGAKGGSEDQAEDRRSAARAGARAPRYTWPFEAKDVQVRTRLPQVEGDAPQAAAPLIEDLSARSSWPTPPARRNPAPTIAAKGALAVIPNNPSRALKYPLDQASLCRKPSRDAISQSSSSSDASPTRFEKTAVPRRRHPRSHCPMDALVSTTWRVSQRWSSDLQAG